MEKSRSWLRNGRNSGGVKQLMASKPSFDNLITKGKTDTLCKN